MRYTLILFAAVFYFGIASADALREQAKALFQPVDLISDESKKYSDAQKELGKALFFDPRLSKSGVISCHSCHNLSLGGADGQTTSTGHGWKQGPINSPTVFNAVYNIDQFWNGRADNLKEQAKGPVLAEKEMANTVENALATTSSIPGYVSMFAKAYPKANKKITYDNIADAIAAFETTLTTPNSKFDKFLLGKGSLNKQERRGLQLFINKGCAGCHSGKAMGGRMYMKFGIVKQPPKEILGDDLGRYAVTKKETDKYVFKVPTLRNVELTAPYFHTGKVWDLKKAISIMAEAQLGMKLSDKEIADIEVFFKTLNGELPKVSLPNLPARAPQTPKPNLM